MFQLTREGLPALSSSTTVKEWVKVQNLHNLFRNQQNIKEFKNSVLPGNVGM